MKRERQPALALVSIGVAIVVVLIAGITTALLAGEGDVPAGGARVRLDGAATVVRSDGTAEALSDGDIVRAGDEVEVTEGTAVLELGGGGTIEARAGRGDVADTLVEVGSPMRLLAGDALADGPTGVAVEAAGTVVTLQGGDGDAAARIRRELAVSTATYRGATAVESAGQEREVRALRQLSVASIGRPSSGDDPLRYDPADLDPWDLRYLGGAIDLTRRLEALSRALTGQGITRVTAGDYEALLPKLADEPAFDDALIEATRPAGETLVGAAIAALGERGDFGDRWDEAFGFHDDGATWGLVALDQGVSEGPVLDDVQGALGRSTQPLGGGRVAAPVVSAPLTPGTTPSTSTPATPSNAAPTTTPTSPTSPTSPGSPAPTTPTTPPVTPPTTPEPTVPPVPPPPGGGEEGDILGGLADPVTDLLGGLIGG